ncbi:MAG: 50S ribosomal protein L22 [Flavobacteriales bacterium]
MGASKKQRAEKLKAQKEGLCVARLNNCPTSPRKMRLVADIIRGEEVFKALSILQYTNKDAARRLEKLLRSAISNWEQKNEGNSPEQAGVFVKEIQVDSARILKRIQPRAQGRAFRIKKRSNHVKLVLDHQN